MRKDARKATPKVADLLTPLVNEILERTSKCVRIWHENDIAVVGTDNRDVTEVDATITGLLRVVPRAEAEARLRGLCNCAVKRPKLLDKLKLVAAALEGEHPRARLKGKRHKHDVRLLTDELRGGLLVTVQTLFERTGAPQHKVTPLASARGVVPSQGSQTSARR